MVATVASDRAAGDQSPGLSLIDCDIHQAVTGDSDLFPHLPRQYVEYVKDFGSMMPGVGCTNLPRNGTRGDLGVDDAIVPGTDPGLVVTQHLDRYGIDQGF
jgi:hypothetical protein